jgi:putative ABC transport system permease protein
LGLDPNAELFRLLDTSNQASIPKPNGGLVITKKLADKLGVSQGDFVEVEVLEGVHRRQRLPIDRIFANYTGPSASIDRATLHEWMREGDRLSGVFLTLDPNYRDEVYQRIK